MEQMSQSLGEINFVLGELKLYQGTGTMPSVITEMKDQYVRDRIPALTQGSPEAAEGLTWWSAADRWNNRGYRRNAMRLLGMQDEVERIDQEVRDEYLAAMYDVAAALAGVQKAQSGVTSARGANLSIRRANVCYSQSGVDRPWGYETYGAFPLGGLRQIPRGIPSNWRIRSTKKGSGGVWYYDPANPGNAVRVMPGDPKSPWPRSQAPYVRWQHNGHPLDVDGNRLPTSQTLDAHIPLRHFDFTQGPF